MLPHANCGACGFPGCRPFAEALVTGAAAPGKCSVSTDDGRARIAAYLGVDVGAEEKRVARLACAGGSNVARNRAHYQGHESCRAAAQVAGGGKGCFWGCLGLADCAVVCDFDAITNECPCASGRRRGPVHRLRRLRRGLPQGPLLDPPGEPPPLGGLPLARGRATSCWRTAKSPAPPAAAAPWTPRGLITMTNNLPVVDYSRQPRHPDADPALPDRGDRLARSEVRPDEGRRRAQGHSQGRAARSPDLRMPMTPRTSISRLQLDLTAPDGRTRCR